VNADEAIGNLECLGNRGGLRNDLQIDAELGNEWNGANAETVVPEATWASPIAAGTGTTGRCEHGSGCRACEMRLSGEQLQKKTVGFQGFCPKSGSVVRT
jgi:hypothetical protein